ncbi:unnamed protein product [Peronospora destructor]|uniref:Uncharacterized protein n=1 Tax=Peronospora destructor TaxID=86335 RepID=A0AAV0TEX1_9STRA|nr:unnamed protein product [Peronospora destructor]
MTESTQRRTISELDISSMRRISDALLLAQNRARRATDRANQTEHMLQVVLAQVDVPRLRVGSLAEWEMLQTAVTSNSMFGIPSPLPRSTLLAPEDAVFVSPSSFLEEVAKNVVINLNTAMTCQKRYVDQLRLPAFYFSIWSHKDRDFFGPVHFVAGFLAGVVVGVILTKQWQLQLRHTHQETPSLFNKLTKWCRRRAFVARTPWHLIPMPMDDYSYLMHPAMVEVA